MSQGVAAYDQINFSVAPEEFQSPSHEFMGGAAVQATKWATKAEPATRGVRGNIQRAKRASGEAAGKVWDPVKKMWVKHSKAIKRGAAYTGGAAALGGGGYAAGRQFEADEELAGLAADADNFYEAAELVGVSEEMLAFNERIDAFLFGEEIDEDDHEFAVNPMPWMSRQVARGRSAASRAQTQVGDYVTTVRGTRGKKARKAADKHAYGKHDSKVPGALRYAERMEGETRQARKGLRRVGYHVAGGGAIGATGVAVGAQDGKKK